MKETDCRAKLIAAATPLFAKKGLHGVSVRELAKACGTNLSMISYYFGGKPGLYEAVVRDVFADLLEMTKVAKADLVPSAKFMAYVYQCGICFHSGAGAEFTPRTASADPNVPECPHCLNNDADSFTKSKAGLEEAA